MDVNSFIRSQEPHRLRENAQEEQFRAALYGGPPSLLARFYVAAYEDEQASKETGFPVFKERIVVHIQSMDSNESQTHIADDDYRAKFPREWELFLKNYEHPKLPLTAIPQISPAILAVFEKMGLRCLEDVLGATLPESFQKFQKWGSWIKSAHEASHGRKMKVSA